MCANLIRPASILPLLLAISLAACANSPLAKVRESVPAPPATRADAVVDTLHGVSVPDPYRWLENQSAPETRAWIDAQNQYTQSLLGSYSGRDAINTRLTELLKIETIGTPSERGGRYFFSKRKADQDLAVICMTEGPTGEPQVLIDPHSMSADKTTSVSISDISSDGKLLLYNVREGGKDEVSIRLFDVDARRDLPGGLPAARYFGVSITPDKKSLYYSLHDDKGSRIYFRNVSDPPESATKLFGDGYGPEKIISAWLTEDGKYLVMVVYHGSAAKKSEVYFKNIATNGPIIPIVNDLDARFEPVVGGDIMYLKTNLDAPKGRVLAVNLLNPIPDNRLARETWTEIIPESKDILEDFSTGGGLLCLSYLHDVKSLVKLYDTKGKHVRDITFPSLGSVSGISGRWDSPEGFFSFTSFHIPATIFRYDITTGAQSEWAKINVPFKGEDYDTQQVWYDSKDGTKIPMFIVHRKGLKLDGKRPTYLTGYGGFNISLTPGFSAKCALWIERGGVYAVPNLRGGGEFGEAWHEAGMLDKKQNVFDDFIAASEWLIKNNYTSSENLAVAGGSNGGLLVGAMLTQRPDLFGAVVCSYPLLDMVRYHRFLVAGFWVPEYGSSEKADQFKTLHAYSPYHRVVKGEKYPATLFITGDSDTRVDPLHARKMAALLQASNGSDRPILLHYDTKAGHSGGKPVTKQITDTTDELAFLFWQVGSK